MKVLKSLGRGLCCITAVGVTAAIKTKSAHDTVKNAYETSLCCLPCQCVVEIKHCFDYCTAKVEPENNSVEMAGVAPADATMA